MDESKICVEVTKKHARIAGAYADPLNCLLAVAFREKMGVVSVGGKYIVGSMIGASNPNGCYIYELTPETLQRVEEAYFPKRWRYWLPFKNQKCPLSALPRKDFKPFIATAFRR